jgi:hypothetical protein
MRKLAMFVPVALVAGYVINDVASSSESPAASGGTMSLAVVEAPSPPEHAEIAVAPTAAVAATVPSVDLSSQLADLAITIPAAVELNAELLESLHIHAAASADIAASVNGLVQLIEEEVDGELDDEQIIAITGSMIADLAATIEARVAIATKELRASRPDTSTEN